MKRMFLFAALFAAVGTTACEEIIGNNKILDEPKIEFAEEQMTTSAEGGEIIIPITSTGIDHAYVLPESNWVQDENGDLLPVDEWIEIVRVVNEYDANADSTRALAQWTSAIVVNVLPNESNYTRKAIISAQSFMVSDNIIIYQSAQNE